MARACIFPGQGSQAVGMGKALADAFASAREVFEEVDEALKQKLSRLMWEGPESDLVLTENAQPAIMAASYAVIRVLTRDCGLDFARHARVAAGHSLGEYTALAAVGAFTLSDAARLLKIRGKAMQAAVPVGEGAMSALLGIEIEGAEAAAKEASAQNGVCVVASENAPGQVVIAGTADAVARAGELAKGLGAKRVMPIPVSGAFHTPLMQGARADLRKALSEVTFLTPEVRVVANVDAHVHDDPAEWPGLLSAQLCSPVRWRQTLETFAHLGLPSLVAPGPGGVLAGLAKRSLPEIQSLAVSRPGDLDTLMDQISAAGTWRAEPALHQGEHLYTSDRVVVSPSSGIFTPESSLQAPGTGLLPGTADSATDPSSVIEVGDLVGRVGVSEVRTPFAGQVIGWMAAAGERVQEGQPL